MQGPSKPNKKQEKQESKRENKTKPIQKKEKNQKKIKRNQQELLVNQHSDIIQSQIGKKQRRDSGAKKGRPKQNNKDMIKVAEDPTLAIQECFLEYLDAIGLKHGLVFREKEREKFKRENKGIHWNSDHQWSQEKEFGKITKNKKVTSAIKKYAGEENEALFDLIIKAFLNICDIAAEECTQELYEILAEALQSNIGNQDQDSKKVRALRFLERSMFLSGKFTDERIKYWVEITEDKNVKEQKFQEFFVTLAKELEKLLEASDKIEQYLNEQDQMKRELQKIRANI